MALILNRMSPLLEAINLLFHSSLLWKNNNYLFSTMLPRWTYFSVMKDDFLFNYITMFMMLHIQQKVPNYIYAQKEIKTQ